VSQRAADRLWNAGIVLLLLAALLADGWLYAMPYWPRLVAAWGG
jgi:hypothetical protein